MQAFIELLNSANSDHYVGMFFLAVRVWLQTAIIFHKTKMKSVACYE